MNIEYPSAQWRDYELVDSGNFEKLERFGSYYLRRPEPKALWDKSMSEAEWGRLCHTWFKPGAGFGRAGKEDSGTWERLKKMDDQWCIRYAPSSAAQDTSGTLTLESCSGSGLRGAEGAALTLRLGLTSFKHVGVFPEQAPNWDWIFSHTKALKDSGVEKPRVLNLFAYTGAASLAAKAAGADVTHLDSVRQVVTWARQNMELSRLDDVRWVVEDAMKFVKREAKRGNKYNGIILDPPAYGHGPDGEKWKLDECLFEMLKGVNEILAPKDSFLVLNLYSNGYSAVLAETLAREAFGKVKSMENGELVLRDRSGKALPLSVFVRLTR